MVNNRFEDIGKIFQARADNVERQMNDIVIQYTDEVLDAELLSTPVDTGKARSNWRVSLSGDLSGEVIEPHSPGKFLGINERVNYAVAKRIGLTKLLDFSVRRGKQITIGNQAPYIGELNQGHSTQNLEPLWIEKNVMRVSAAFRPIARLLGSRRKFI